MKRLGLVAVILSLAVAGCSSDPDPAPTPTTGSSVAPDPTTTASPDVSASASASSAAIVFTVDGAGPYQLGATLTALQAAGALESVATNGELCPTNKSAHGTGVWKDTQLSFRADGALYLVVNRSTKIPTPSGAWLGMTLAALQSIYGPIGKELNAGGGAVAYLVTTDTGRGILFDLDDKKKVMTMIAGEADYLKSSYLGGSDFC